MQKKLLIANWKSHKSQSEAKAWFTTFTTKLSAQKNESYEMSVVVAPSSIYLESAIRLVEHVSSISIAAQDVSQFPLGSYTGAIAATQLFSLGVRYALVGHSERRRYFGETSQVVGQKIEQLLENAITPIVCVDEKEMQQQAEMISTEHRRQCVVAYEPVSAIGTGIGEDVSHVTGVISIAKQAFGDIPILYGGSVDLRNINEYLLVADGALIGAASLDPAQFFQLLVSASSKPNLLS
jgi:triosephosphate isomerase